MVRRKILYRDPTWLDFKPGTMGLSCLLTVVATLTSLKTPSFVLNPYILLTELLYALIFVGGGPLLSESDSRASLFLAPFNFISEAVFLGPCEGLLGLLKGRPADSAFSCTSHVVLLCLCCCAKETTSLLFACYETVTSFTPLVAASWAFLRLAVPRYITVPKVPMTPDNNDSFFDRATYYELYLYFT